MSCSTHKARKTFPISLRRFPKIARFRYFGTNTTWYLQYHRACERLCHSRMTVSSRANGQVRATETVAYSTPTAHDGTAEAASSHTARGGGLPLELRPRDAADCLIRTRFCVKERGGRGQGNRVLRLGPACRGPRAVDRKA